jgi:hypothetical protein
VWGNDDVLLVSAAYPTRRGNVKYTSTRLYKYDLSTDNKLKPFKIIINITLSSKYKEQ